MRVKFWQKTLAALLVVGVLPIAFVNAVSIQGTRDRLTELGVTNIRERAVSTANAIDSYLQGPLGDVVLVSKLPAVIAYAQNVNDPDLRRAAREVLAAASARSVNYESIAIVSIDGTISAASITTDEGTNVRFRDYFLNARAGLSYISDPSYSVITNKPALFFSSPIATTSGLVVGVARMRANLSGIWDLVEADSGSVGVGSHGFLVDDYGIRLAVSETKGHRAQAESLIYKPIAAIDPEVAKKLATTVGSRVTGFVTHEPTTTFCVPAAIRVICGEYSCMRMWVSQHQTYVNPHASASLAFATLKCEVLSDFQTSLPPAKALA